MELLRKLSSKGSRRRGMVDDDLSPRSSKSAASLSAAFLAQGMRVAWKVGAGMPLGPLWAERSN